MITPDPAKSTHYLKRVEYLNELELKGNMIFIGDSITSNFHLKEHFPDLDTINLGIPGETTSTLLYRIKEYDLSLPSKVMLMIGVNDIGRSVNLAKFSENFEKIIRNLSICDCDIYVYSILNSSEFKRDNNQIDLFNRYLEESNASFGYTYIDLNRELNSQKITIHTSDGLHISDDSYNVWRNVINREIFNVPM
ncbi:GDSL-type esterase/lipase family protein [Vibrio makurazakiensis]|uniref:GDSL-type esterase/lipase family protein n=1 Tax=Vibrio makurazakiensis TaxID=2910250 RepID=UPI003D137EB4